MRRAGNTQVFRKWGEAAIKRKDQMKLLLLRRVTRRLRIAVLANFIAKDKMKYFNIKLYSKPPSIPLPVLTNNHTVQRHGEEDGRNECIQGGKNKKKDHIGRGWRRMSGQDYKQTVPNGKVWTKNGNLWWKQIDNFYWLLLSFHRNHPLLLFLRTWIMIIITSYSWSRFRFNPSSAPSSP